MSQPWSTPAAASHVLADTFPHTRHPGPSRAEALLSSLPSHALAGGSVYDALVAAAAAEHGLVLVSRDRRAAETYRRLGVRHELLP